MTRKKSQLRTASGLVLKKSSDKTISVSLIQTKTHPIYKKKYQITRKYLVHDEKNQSQAGDRVTIQETRPRSRRKRWTVIKIETSKKT